MVIPPKVPAIMPEEGTGAQCRSTLKQAQQVSILKKKWHANVALQGSARDQNADEEPNLGP
ncbi:hypothetical protein ABIE89_003756 [Bradyrhizobium niftali]|uniref:hypothetical protein n=1 Tax=Bradyrhizobium niftali TaxID=2560055 RepID=UPI003835EA02